MSRLNAKKVWDDIEALKASGVPATKAFEQYAESTGSLPGTVTAAYYRHNKTLRAQDDPPTISERLQGLVDEVRELENREVEVNKILAQLPR